MWLTLQKTPPNTCVIVVCFHKHAASLTYPATNSIAEETANLKGLRVETRHNHQIVTSDNNFPAI